MFVYNHISSCDFQHRQKGGSTTFPMYLWKNILKITCVLQTSSPPYMYFESYAMGEVSPLGIFYNET